MQKREHVPRQFRQCCQLIGEHAIEVQRATCSSGGARTGSVPTRLLFQGLPNWRRGSQVVGKRGRWWWLCPDRNSSSFGEPPRHQARLRRRECPRCSQAQPGGQSSADPRWLSARCQSGPELRFLVAVVPRTTASSSARQLTVIGYQRESRQRNRIRTLGYRSRPAVGLIFVSQRDPRVKRGWLLCSLRVRNPPVATVATATVASTGYACGIGRAWQLPERVPR